MVKRRRPNDELAPRSRSAPILGTHGSMSLINFHRYFTDAREKGEIDSETKKWAAFADTSYKNTTKQKERALAKHLEEDNWVLDTEHTNRQKTVWVNDDTKQVVTSFRGKTGTVFAVFRKMCTNIFQGQKPLTIYLLT